MMLNGTMPQLSSAFWVISGAQSFLWQCKPFKNCSLCKQSGLLEPSEQMNESSWGFSSPPLTPQKKIICPVGEASRALDPLQYHCSEHIAKQNDYVKLASKF